MQVTQGALFRHCPNKEAIWESAPSLDSEAAAILFIGTVQGLVMQTLLVGDVEHMRRNAPRVFAIDRRSITGP